MLDCILEINISIIHLHLLCLYFKISIHALKHDTQYLDEAINYGHQYNSHYVYSQQPVRDYVVMWLTCWLFIVDQQGA